METQSAHYIIKPKEIAQISTVYTSLFFDPINNSLTSYYININSCKHMSIMEWISAFLCCGLQKKISAEDMGCGASVETTTDLKQAGHGDWGV